MDRSTREREINRQVGRCGQVICSCIYTHLSGLSLLVLQWPDLKLLQHLALGSQLLCCNILHWLITTLSTQSQVLNHRVATSHLNLVQHPVLTTLQDFSIWLNHCCNTPLWVKVWIWVRVITQTQHQQRTMKCASGGLPPRCPERMCWGGGEGIYTNRVMQTEMQDTPGVQEW